MERDSLLRIAASPHIQATESTSRIMWNVVGSLVPIIVFATWVFGPSALLVVVTCVIAAVGTERVLAGTRPVRDGSAAITGILLGLTLPPGFPLWMAALGGVVAIAAGKAIFGGLGQNVFNPALVGRAFLQAAFPTAITTWPAARASWWSLAGDNFAAPFMHGVDGVTAATPLGLMKFEQQGTALYDLALGTTGGSIGETAGVLILLCGGYLALRGHLDWRVPVAIMATVAALATLFHAVDPARYPDAGFMLFSGGLMLGAVYMATDMVTSPVTRAGAWVFGVGIGALVVLIRLWGGLPEGVMYSILLMNALVPFINRATRPRVFGTARRGATA